MEPSLTLANDDLWNRVRAWLDRVKTGPDMRMSLAEFTPRVAGGFSLLSITAREFLGEKMLAELLSGLSAGGDLRGLDYAILLLADPYFSRTASQNSARRILRTALNKDLWVLRSFRELEAIANALIMLAYKEPSPNFWYEFYNHFESEPGAFDVAFSGLLDCGLQVALDFVRPICTEFVANRVVSYLPRLNREHQRDRLQDQLNVLLDGLEPPQAKALRAGAVALGLHLADTASGKLLHLPGAGGGPKGLPRELQRSLDHFKLEKAYHVGRMRLPPVRVILSKYTGVPDLYTFQDHVLELLKMIAAKSGETLESFESNSFEELRLETRPYSRDFFAFPMYLTKSKRNVGDGVLAYGRHCRLGVLVPRRSRASNELRNRETIGLGQLLKVAAGNHLEVLYLQNYALGEMVLEQLQGGRAFHAGGGPRRVPLPPRLPKGRDENRDDELAGLPALDGKRSDWLYLFDLGDAVQVAALRKTTDFSGCTELKVKHKLRIPVGLGFTKYAAEWVANHYQEIAAGLEKYTSSHGMRTLFSRIGVELTRTPGPSPIRNITRSKRTAR